LPSGNLLGGLDPAGPDERVETLLATRTARLERIVSRGHATPAGQWYDQAEDEWVLLVQGGAGLRLEGADAVRTLGPGDWLLIPAHVRHRVEWTAPAEPTIWLCLFLAP
jgi:cupin 2 domain-containing protein